MNKKDAQKFFILGILIAVILVSRFMFLGFSVNTQTVKGAGAAGNASNTNANNPPILVLPSLADVSAQQGMVSSSGNQIIIGNDQPAQSSSTPLTTTVPPPQPAVSSVNPPGLNDAESLVANLGTGENYLDVNANERWPLASVSKLMTAVIATDVFSPGQQIAITQPMVDADPTESILHVGDTYTVSDLLRIMLLPSNNVAAESLAQFYGRAQFLAAMNAKAKLWGMTDTYYDDPSGLSAGNQSTADDLLKLAQNIEGSYPQVLAITRMPQAAVTNLATNQLVTVKSINEFAGQADFIGGKTGYTDQADGNLLSIFSYDGKQILIVVMGINDSVRFDGTQALYNWFKANFK